MKVMQLHDKFTEQIVGSILVTEKNTEDYIVDAWENFLAIHYSNSEEEPDIWEFINHFPKMDMQYVEIDFYQPW